MPSKLRNTDVIVKPKWLKFQDALAYTGMRKIKFYEQSTGLTKSRIGGTIYYKVSELDELFESNVFVRKVA